MTDITVDQLTTEEIAGSGVFDKLMNVCSLHVKEEFNSGRIKGDQYANVYLGAMTAVLQQSVTFLLQEQAAGLQADLLAEQIANAQKENELLTEQKAKLQQEVELLKQKLYTEQSQILDATSTTPVATPANTGIVGVIGKQKALYNNQSDGFIRDAEQKAAKMVFDHLAVSASTTTPPITPLNEDPAAGGSAATTRINNVVTKLLQGAGLEGV